MRGLELAAVMHDLAFWGDERLGHVDAARIALAVAQDNEDSGFSDGGSDGVHLGRVTDEGIGHVFMEELDIVNWAVRPH